MFLHQRVGSDIQVTMSVNCRAQKAFFPRLFRDKLGRLLHDRITALGTGIDPTVKRSSIVHRLQAKRILTAKVSSHDDATPGAASDLIRRDNSQGQAIYSATRCLITIFLGFKRLN